MYITWYGTASLKLECEGGSLLFDPFLKMLPEGYEPAQARPGRQREFSQCRTVLLTHGHLDHASQLAEIYPDRDVDIYCTATPREHLIRQGFAENRIHLIAPGDAVELNGSRISVCKGQHIKNDMKLIHGIIHDRRSHEYFADAIKLLELNRRWPENGETVMFDITGDGRRLQIMGSDGFAPDEMYAEFADALVLPLQGRSDIAEYSLKTVARLLPARVLLDHFDDAFVPLTQRVDTTLFMDLMKQKFPDIPVEEMVEGKKVEI